MKFSKAIKISVVVFSTMAASVAHTAGETAGATEGLAAQPSVQEGAGTAVDKNKTGQAMSYLMGGYLFTESSKHFSACSPYSYGQCVLGAIKLGMGVLSLQQGKAHGTSASGAKFTMDNSYGGSNPYDSGNYDIVDTTSPLNDDPTFKSLPSVTKDLVDKGIYNPKTGTIKTPDGKTYKVSDFSSPEAMAAAGIPAGAIAGAAAYADSLSKKVQGKVEKMKLGALTESNGYAEGGGGSASGSNGYSTGDSSSSSSYGMQGGGLGKGLGLDRDPAQVAGMQKNYNGEPIGVAADSIFLMMNRRYKVKEKQDSFFTDLDTALQK